MAFKHVAVFGIFKRNNEVKNAISKLESDGFLHSDIVIFNSNVSDKLDIERLQKTMILSFAKVGSCVGGVIFLILGLAIASGILEVGFFTGMNVLYKIFALLTLVFFGVLFGAAGGALVGIGTPQATLLRLGNYIDAGGTLLSVRVGDVGEECRAKESIELSGARNINVLAEADTWKSIHKIINPT